MRSNKRLAKNLTSFSIFTTKINPENQSYNKCRAAGEVTKNSWVHKAETKEKQEKNMVLHIPLFQVSTKRLEKSPPAKCSRFYNFDAHFAWICCLPLHLDAIEFSLEPILWISIQHLVHYSWCIGGPAKIPTPMIIRCKDGAININLQSKIVYFWKINK